MPLEDAQQIRISLTALAGKELASLPEDDPWWAKVVQMAASSRALRRTHQQYDVIDAHTIEPS